MVRLNLASWLTSSSSNNSNSRDEGDLTTTERKKINRRSFAGFGTVSPFSSTKTKMSNGGGGMNGKTSATSSSSSNEPAHNTTHTTSEGAERPSTSSTTEQAGVPASPQPTNTMSNSSSNETSMTALAETISRETAKLEKYLKDNGLPMPAFGVDAADDFPKLPDEMQKSRLEVIHATKQLRDLTIGPKEGVRWGVWGVSVDFPTS